MLRLSLAMVVWWATAPRHVSDPHDVARGRLQAAPVQPQHPTCVEEKCRGSASWWFGDRQSFGDRNPSARIPDFIKRPFLHCCSPQIKLDMTKLGQTRIRKWASAEVSVDVQRTSALSISQRLGLKREQRKQSLGIIEYIICYSVHSVFRTPS